MKPKTYQDFKKEAEQYKPILKDFKDTQKVFVDPNFHPNCNIKERDSIFDDPNIKWIRIDEIYKAPLFQRDLIHPDYIMQGKIGDCYLMSTFSRISAQPELVKTLFNIEESRKILPIIPDSIDLRCGAVVIYFHCFGRRTPVLTDTYLPTKNGTLLFSYPSDNLKSAWFCLVEKAYAKLNGSYSKIIGGTFGNAIYNIFGYYPTTKSFNSFTKEKLAKMSLFDRIMKYQRQQAVMAAGINLEKNKNGVTEEELDKKGLISQHSYLILKVRIHDNKKFFCLRNPWGKNEWNGDWSDKSPLWTPELKVALDWKDAENGTFWMNDKDFFYYFTDIEVSKPIRPEWITSQFCVQLTPGDHDGHSIDSEKCKILERPNFAFQVIEQIPFNERVRFHVIIEKRNNLFDEEKNIEINPPEYSVIVAHINGKKFDPKLYHSVRGSEFIRSTNIFSFHYSVIGNFDIVTMALNRSVKSNIIEDYYITVCCEKDFKLYNIDRPDDIFPKKRSIGYIFNNASKKHIDVAKPLKPGQVNGNISAIVLGNLTSSSFDPKNQEYLAKKTEELINMPIYDSPDNSIKVIVDIPKPKDDNDIINPNGFDNEIIKENEKLKEILNRFLGYIQVNKNEAEKSKGIIKELTKNLQNEQEKNQKLLDSYNELKTNLNSTILELDLEKDKNETIKKQINILKKENEETKKILKKKDQKIIDTENQFQKMKEQLNEISIKNEKLQYILREKKQNITNANKEINETKSRLIQITTEKERIEKEKQNEIMRLKQEIERLKNPQTISDTAKNEEEKISNRLLNNNPNRIFKPRRKLQSPKSFIPKTQPV